MWVGREHLSRWLHVHCPNVIESWSGCLLGCLLLLCATIVAGLVAWMPSGHQPGAEMPSPREGRLGGGPPVPGSGYNGYTGGRNDDETPRSAQDGGGMAPPGARHHRRLLGLAVAAAMGAGGEGVF